MCRISFTVFLALLLSPRAADFCSAQQQFGSELRRWELDVGSPQVWSVDEDFPHWRLNRADSHLVSISSLESRVLRPVEGIYGITKDDFLVNDDTTGECECWHEFPAVAMDTLGNFVICWDDQRNGEGNFDIYAQRYSSSGNPLGTNFRVNDDTGIKKPTSSEAIFAGQSKQ